MADEERLLESLAVVQYEKCDLCRRNHRKGKGHVYTKAHRTVLQNVITKFSKKVSLAKKSVKVPGVHGPGWEVGARRWCYFCKAEVERHSRDAITAIQDATFLRHLASEEHKTNTLKFWREQRLEKDKHPFFLVEEEKLKKYEAAWKVAVDCFLTEQELKRKTEAARIARQETMRARLVTHQRHHVMSQIAQNEYNDQHWEAPSAPSDSGAFVRTVAANAAGLTVVAPRAYDKNVGNIHSGALPPWMQNDSSDLDPATISIGPTEDDLKKHLESERKRKLPATRVGAKFDHQGATGAEWLPSFGRVWSSQRRTHGQKHFMQALQKPTAAHFHNRQRPSSAMGRAHTSMGNAHTTRLPIPTTSAASATSNQPRTMDMGINYSPQYGNNSNSSQTCYVDSKEDDSDTWCRHNHVGHPYHSANNGRGHYGIADPQAPSTNVGHNGGHTCRNSNVSDGQHTDQRYINTGVSFTPRTTNGHVPGQTQSSSNYPQYQYHSPSNSSFSQWTNSETVGTGTSSYRSNITQQQPPKKVSRIKIASSLLK